MADSLLEVKDLETQFKTSEGVVHAVNGVSFSLSSGETLGVVGESGCGKSVTMLSCLRLIASPPGKIMAGEALFRGRDLLKVPAEEIRKIRGAQISMVFQDPMTSLNPVMTIGKQLAEPLMLHLNMSHEQARMRSIDLLGMVGIPNAAERLSDYPHQYSGGMRQRVMIAMGLSCNPEILIADEPTTALDVTIQAQVLDMMNGLKNKFGTSMILITHDLGVVAQVCDKVAIMYAGEIIEAGSLKDIFENTKHPYTKGLFGSIPNLEEEVDRLSPIKGLMPDPTDIPKGCPFHPRCPHAAEVCTTKVPNNTEVNEGHTVRCMIYEGLVEPKEVQK